MKIRIKFAKEGTMKFIGHLDIMRYFQKVMRRADVDIRYSEGFSPHQIMSFAAPLGVGLESLGEYVDIEVLSTDSSAEMLRRINAAMVEGMKALEYKLLPDNAANAMSVVAAADYTLQFREGYEPEDWETFAAGLERFMAQDQILIMKKTKKSEKEIDIRPMIYELKLDGHKICMKIATGSAANLKPDAVIRAYLESIGQTMADFALMITRTEVYANQGEEGQLNLCTLGAFGEDIE
ncbi:MAG: TIGR03936 family radical SAM-associated protein [Lachnospiraceae bacterium]|nr:TIGR03936 family radical SAM-associated protein [Lachnospiraceae bacterium]